MNEVRADTSHGLQRGVFNTKIPSAVGFGIGILLFFMPFVDIKCNSMTLQKVTGAELATGFKIKGPGSDDSLVGDFDKMDNDKTELNAREGKNDPNIFALIAMGLAVVSFVLTLLNTKGAVSGSVITGSLSAAALIAVMIDVKRKAEVDIPEITKRALDASGSDRLGNELYISIDFTAWFYLAALVIIAATWLCYRRMKTSR